MVLGGGKLSAIKKRLAGEVKEGISALAIETLADKLIAESKGQASFKMVPRYNWATCVNVNSGVVHGIPKKEVIFKDGDLVSIDVGLFYEGYHTDTAITVGVGKLSSKKEVFLKAGRQTLSKAIKEARLGNRVGDISNAIEKSLSSFGLAPITQLVGHGVGKKLHQEPFIPCFLKEEIGKTPVLTEGLTIAIEVMYTESPTDLILEDDGWTIRTKDGKIAGLFEETVAVTRHGPLVLTEPEKVPNI